MSEGLDFMEVSHQVIRIKRKPWMEGKKLETVTSIEMLKKVVDECIAAPYYSWDLETTGLDKRVFNGRTVDKIVGHCLSPDVNTGYYIPVRHKESEHHNLPLSAVNEEMRRLADHGKIAIFHNAGFDHEFLEYGESEPIGEWDNRDKFEDTQYLCYLTDSRRKKKGLKECTKDFLEWEMIELKELFPPDQPRHLLDFSLLDPTEEAPTLYAASDSICTLALYEMLHKGIVTNDHKGISSQKTIYLIEKMCITATRWMERARLPLNRKKVEELIIIGQDDFIDAIEKFYKAAGEALDRDIQPAWVTKMVNEYAGHRETVRIDNRYIKDLRAQTRAQDPIDRDGKVTKTGGSKGEGDNKIEFLQIYDVKSNPQLGVLLTELGVKLPRTEKGNITTAKDVLDDVIEKEGEKFEYMKQIKRLREVEKALGTFLLPMESDSDPNDDSLWVQFKQHGTDTGRYSTPGKKDKGWGLQGGTSMNLHSLPSKDKKGKVECMRRIRECIAAREGKVLVAIDYSGVELRLVTALSREPLWIEAFFKCSTCGKQYPNEMDEDGLLKATPAYCYSCGDDRIGDLHTVSGIAFYGDKAPDQDNWKELRGYAKNTNFALLYGGTGNTVSSRVGCDKNEGWRIYKQFNSTYKGLERWQKAQVKMARKYGFVTTALGRRYPTPEIDNEIKWIREKNERNAINGPIQGSSADLTKLAMGSAYLLVKKNGWFGKVNMLITIHDELVFEIDKDIFEEAVAALNQMMTRNGVIKKLKWPITLQSDVEFGEDWSVPYDRKDWIFQRQGALYGYHDKKKDKQVPGWPQWALDLFTEDSIDPVVREKLIKEGKLRPAVATDAPPSDTPANDDPSAETPATEAQEPETAPSPNPAAAKPAHNGVSPSVPRLQMGEKYIYVLHRPLTFGCIEALAQVVIRSSRLGGSHPLRVELPDGKVVLDESDGVEVDVNRFLTYAQDQLEVSA